MASVPRKPAADTRKGKPFPAGSGLQLSEYQVLRVGSLTWDPLLQAWQIRIRPVARLSCNNGLFSGIRVQFILLGSPNWC